VSDTEIRKVVRTLHKEETFYVRVAAGTPKDKVLEVCLEGDAMYGTPHKTYTQQSNVDVRCIVAEPYAKKFGEPLDLVEETK
jgi:hypothetical protein